MAEITTYNTTLAYGSTATLGTVVKIKSYPDGLIAKRSAIEATDLSDDAQRFKKGIRQTGDSLDFTANYDKDVFAAINSLSAEQYWGLTFSDGSKITGKGELSASLNGGGVDQMVEMTISIMPTTVPEFSEGSL